jgi:glutamyl/glutaminyl-tRNA synthetase
LFIPFETSIFYPQVKAMDPVRTRFAPSPTGFLHIGGLRTALFAYLFARHNRGSFILRIEDTDRSRFVEGALEDIMGSLRWIGISWDEGPGVGGAFGPYQQSERREIYEQHVRRLMENGNAYPCYCTPERLSALREEQRRQGLDPGYDRHCRELWFV